MRFAGAVRAAQGLGPHDHLCWAYDESGEFRSRLLEFVSDGLQLGQRVSYVASGEVEALWHDLRGLDGVAQAQARGAVQVQSLDSVYHRGAVLEPAGQVEAYATATQAALAAGFTGLRVAAEATPLVRGAAQLEAFTRYEHLVDRYMVRQPFSAMCAYDRGELGDRVITQLACLHPSIKAGSAPFRLHASSRAAAALGGELDLLSRTLFPTALERADPHPVRDELVFDAVGLDFIDHQSLVTLADFARSRDATAVLRTGLTTPARLIEILQLDRVRVELPV